MRECRTSGSVRGVPSNGHPYRNPREAFEESFAWIAALEIFPTGEMGAGRYEEAIFELPA